MKRKIVVSASVVSALIGSAVLVAPNATADPTTLANGFTAAVVAHSGQTVSGHIDATGYDLGVYVGPGVHGVTVSAASVTGANDEGILVQDTSGVVIKDSTVAGNSTDPTSDLTERKGIVLIGTNGVVVSGNTVTHNGDGGIGVYDDGPKSPSAPVALVTTGSIPSVGNLITRNTIVDNFGGCGIVVSAKEDGGLVSATVVSDNTVTADIPGALGGMIIASGSVGAGTVAHAVFAHNTVSGGYIAGIGMHTSPGGVLTGTQIIGNHFSANGGNESGGGTGVEILSGGTVANTQILHDTVSDDYYGVFHVGDTATHISHLATDGVTMPVAP